MQYIWQTVLIFIIGTALLRIGGRKSISQMTVPQTIIMIAIGTLLIQPVTGHGLWPTFGYAAILTLCLIAAEWISIKMDKAETLISGKSKPVIINSKLQIETMRHLRLTVDQLESRMRQKGISSIEDVQYATLESNGQLGYMLRPEKQPVTKEDLDRLITMIQNGQLAAPPPSSTDNIFSETNTKQPTKDESDFLQ